MENSESCGNQSLQEDNDHLNNDSWAECSPFDLPKHNASYGNRDYWEQRFANEKQYEWLLSYDHLAHQIATYVKKTDRILIIGCGNAPFSADLYDAGYENLVNIDYSENVIRSMKERHGTSRPKMEWRVMDITKMDSFDDNTFDVVIDKATLDALTAREGDVWNPDESVVREMRSACQHISRIIKADGGVFLSISLTQPHFRQRYLLGWHGNSADTTNDRFSNEFGWTLQYMPAGRDVDRDCFCHYFYVMIKQSNL